MGVMIRVDSRKAFLRDGVWKAADPNLEELLNRLTEDWIRTSGGPPLHSRNLELSVAEEMARRFGGRIASVVPPSSATASHYLSRRQMSFDF